MLRAAVRSVERRRIRRRRIGLALAVLVVVPSLVAGAVWGGRSAWRAMFAENDFFRIGRIDVTTDGTLAVDNVLEYARVKEGMNLFSVDPGEIRELLLSVPVVADVQVGRRLPDTLVIELAERVAVARLGLPGGNPLAVDMEGHVLGPGSVRPSLPTIMGVRDANLRPGDVVSDPMLPEALRVLDICNQANMRKEMSVATIDLGSEEYLDLGLATGEQLLLSRDGLEEKLRQFPVMRSVARDRGLELVVYDMTVSRNYVGRPAATNVEEVAEPDLASPPTEPAPEELD